MNYSLHDPLVLELHSRTAQAAKILRVLEHYAQSAGLSLARSACLDVGSSAGIITRALAPHFRRVVGVDIDAHALLLATASEAPVPASFAAASALALPFADGTFDLAVCSQVYQYVPDGLR